MVRIVFIGSDKCYRLKILEKIPNSIINNILISDNILKLLPKDVIDLFIVEHYNSEKSEKICQIVKSSQLFNHIPMICLTNNVDDDIEYTDIIVSDYISDKEFIYQVNTLLKMKLIDDELKKEKILLELKVKDRTNELEDKAEKLKITLNSIGDGVIVTDQNGFITTMNPIAMELTELSKNDYYKKHIDEILNITVNGSKIYIFNNVIKFNKPYFIEDGAILHSKSGKSIIISDSASPMISKNGNLNGIVVVFRDITSEYEMRNKIVESEKNYRRIFNNVPDIIYTTDIYGNFTSINSNGIFGYNLEDIIGHNITEFTYSDGDTNQVKQNIILKLNKEKTTTQYTVFVKAKNNDIIPIEIRSQITMDDFNNPIELFGIARDLTERRKKEKIIQENEERYKNIFHNMDSGVGVFKTIDGENFYFIEWNSKAKEMELKNEEDVIGKEIYDVFPEFEKNNFKNYLLSVWINEDSITIDNFYYESNNGKIKGWRKFFIYKLKTSNEIVVIGDDVTEIYEYQNKLKIEKEKAEESDKLKSIFLANMSHEIRTPMNSIIGFSALINTNTPHERLDEYVDIITSSGNLLLTLIDDILDVARIQSGNMNIDKNYFDLREMIFKSEQEYIEQSKIRKKEHIKIEIDIPEEDIILFSDSLRIKQVINNLISNALKFTKNGSIKYGYRIKNDFVEFFVHDTGIGIHEDNISKIFNMFVQIVNRSDKKQEGTGLGLTICKAIVDLLNGKIWVESEFQRGSTFYFTLPYEKINSSINISRKVPDKIKKYNWSDKKLLLIEDNDNNSKLAEIILEPTKIQIIRAKNRSEFYDFYKNDIDIILMDVQLPDCNGYDLIKQIREYNKEIPIITITAFTSRENEILSYEMGANFFMTKPIKWFDLFLKIDELL